MINRGTFKCNKCGNIWTTSFNNVINNLTGCPFCRKSKGEKIIETFLREEEFTYTPQYKVIYN